MVKYHCMLGSERNNATVIPEELVNALRTAERVVVLTGAGVSAESGVPTFRGGFWDKYDPRVLATPEGFEGQPRFVWDWYLERRNQLEDVSPNPGHYGIAAMQRFVKSLVVVTQNIDGLHQKAGSEDVVELHGNLERNICSRERTEVRDFVDHGGDDPPLCPGCGAMLRPDVVWFGEMLPVPALDRAIDESRRCDVLFSVGTSSVVYPAASLPYEALENSAVVVEVNPEPTPLTRQAAFSFRGSAGEIMPALLSSVWPESEDAR